MTHELILHDKRTKRVMKNIRIMQQLKCIGAVKRKQSKLRMKYDTVIEDIEVRKEDWGTVLKGTMHG